MVMQVPRKHQHPSGLLIGIVTFLNKIQKSVKWQELVVGGGGD